MFYVFQRTNSFVKSCCDTAAINFLAVGQKFMGICPTKKKKKGKRYSCYRPWKPLGLREVEALTLIRQTANRWRQGYQPYEPAALHPFTPRFLF
jgi:hypothetical protein